MFKGHLLPPIHWQRRHTAYKETELKSLLVGGHFYSMLHTSVTAVQIWIKIRNFSYGVSHYCTVFHYSAFRCEYLNLHESYIIEAFIPENAKHEIHFHGISGLFDHFSREYVPVISALSWMDAVQWHVSKLIYTFNSSPPSAAYMHQWTGYAYVHVMVCRLFRAKPLAGPMLAYCRLDP